MLVVEAWATEGSAYETIIREGTRNSWESWEKGDSIVAENAQGDTLYIIGQKDKQPITNLTTLGDDHGKTNRQLHTAIRIRASWYFWKDFDVYLLGVQHPPHPEDLARNSTSQMHTLGRHAFDEELMDLSDMDVEDRVAYLALLNRVREKWLAAGGRRGPQARPWRALLQCTGGGWNYTCTLSINEQAFRHMYFARRNHRLEEWRTLCRWIETEHPSRGIITATRD